MCQVSHKHSLMAPLLGVDVDAPHQAVGGGEYRSEGLMPVSGLGCRGKAIEEGCTPPVEDWRGRRQGGERGVDRPEQQVGVGPLKGEGGDAAELALRCGAALGSENDGRAGLPRCHGQARGHGTSRRTHCDVLVECREMKYGGSLQYAVNQDGTSTLAILCTHTPVT